MSTRAWTMWGAAASVLVVAVFTLASRRPHAPALLPMTGSCATGLGTSAQCSEWNGTNDGKRTCQTLQGTWRDAPCPADASSAGGTCTIDGAGVQSRIHYGSAWAVAFKSQTRAEWHCAAQHGVYTR